MPEQQVVASSSTREPTLAEGLETLSGIEGCRVVGKALAERVLCLYEDVCWSKHIEVVKPPNKRFHGKLAELVQSFRKSLDRPSNQG